MAVVVGNRSGERPRARERGQSALNAVRRRHQRRTRTLVRPRGSRLVSPANHRRRRAPSRRTTRGASEKYTAAATTGTRANTNQSAARSSPEVPDPSPLGLTSLLDRGVMIAPIESRTIFRDVRGAGFGGPNQRRSESSPTATRCASACGIRDAESHPRRSWRSSIDSGRRHRPRGAGWA